MRAVADHGRPLVEDPDRLNGVAALGLDETSFLKATRVAATRYVTGLVDLECGRLQDLVADRTKAAVDGCSASVPATGWPTSPRSRWTHGVATPARWWHRLGTPPWSLTTSTPSGWPTPWSTRFAAAPSKRPWATGPQARSAVPHPQAAADRARAAHPAGTGTATGWACRRGSDRRGGRGLAGQGAAPGRLRRGRHASSPRRAGRFYRWADGVGVAELSRLARTVRTWEAEILAWHATGGCSNGPTEAMNLLIKKVKRVGHGFRNFTYYRLRLLLHCGVRWQTHRTARLRGRSPRLMAASREGTGSRDRVPRWRVDEPSDVGGMAPATGGTQQAGPARPDATG
jgi:transposase